MVSRFALFARGVLLVLVALCCSTALRADVTGSVQGQFMIGLRVPIVGARVLITNVATNSSQETVYRRGRLIPHVGPRGRDRTS